MTQQAHQQGTVVSLRSVASGADAPAHSLDAEAAVLSAVLLGDAVAIASMRESLRADMFFADVHRRIAKAVLALDQEHRKLDAVTVATWLREHGEAVDVPTVCRIVDATPAVANVADHVRIVLERWQLRELARRCTAIAAYCRGEFGDVRRVLDRARASVVEITDIDTKAGRGASMAECVRDMLEAMKAAALAGSTTTGTLTGFLPIDDATAGFQPEQMWVIAGRPGQGKTSLALQIATNVAATPDGAPRRGVHVFSLEMSQGEVTRRMVTTEARVNLKAFQAGDFTAGDLQAFNDAAHWFNGLPIHVDTTKGITLTELRSRALSQKDEFLRDGVTPALVVVDYLQLVKVPNADSPEEAVAEVARELKNLAGAMRVPILALAQMNRSVEQREGRPRLSDLRGSGEIENAADLVAFIHHTKKHPGVAFFCLEKQRSGPARIALPLKWRPEFTRFDALEPGEPIPDLDEPAMPMPRKSNYEPRKPL